MINIQDKQLFVEFDFKNTDTSKLVYAVFHLPVGTRSDQSNLKEPIYAAAYDMFHAYDGSNQCRMRYQY